jgi:hypothetical protein
MEMRFEAQGRDGVMMLVAHLIILLNIGRNMNRR